MKNIGVYKKDAIDDIINNFGSVQHVKWLSEDEKQVFRTAFEMDQHVLIRRASDRSKFVDQWQSLNLFFSADTPEEKIAEVHQHAFTNKNILGLYYIHSKSGISGSKETENCIACQ
jgi:ribonucleoside-diphosphate reductase alpha chain